jgi:Tol biopolymer transport system component
VSVRRLAVAVSLALLTLGVSGATAAAPLPAGPRLAVNVSRPYPDLGGIETVGPNGEAPVQLLDGSGEHAIDPSGQQPVWSPDGSQIAFTDSYGEYSPVPYVVGAEGGKPRLVSKETVLSDPVFSPDGRWLAYSALRVVKGHFERSGARSRRYGVIVDWSIRAVDVVTGKHKQLTPWRRHQQLTPTSFSPDGKKIAALAYDLGKSIAAVSVEVGSGRTTVLARNAEEPVYSPDGSRVAFIRTKYVSSPSLGSNKVPAISDLFVMPASGGKPTKLVRVKGGLAWPSWDPSGQRISFTRLGGGSPIGSALPAQGNSVAEVNADGTCLKTLLSIKRGFYLGTAWQPGPGREAGPIAC